MKLKKSLMAAAIATALASGTAFGASLANDGQGDLLFIPSFTVYMESASTNLTVTNSDPEKSVVAKLVLREELNSKELIDVMLYLSPGDRWAGSVKCLEYSGDGSGCLKGELSSSDGSLLASVNVAIDIPPGGVEDEDFKCKQLFKYVPADQRVWGGANGDGAYTFELCDASDRDPQTGECSNPQPFNQGYGEVFGSHADALGAAPLDKNVIYENDKNAVCGTSPATDVPNVLSGTTVLDIDGATARIPMEAVADYDNLTNMNVSLETFLGEGAATSIGELEELLAKNFLVAPYQEDEETFVILTFPTKQSAGVGGTPSPYFWGAGGVGMEVNWASVVRDMEENTTIVVPEGQQCFFDNSSPPQFVCEEKPECVLNPNSPACLTRVGHEMSVTPLKQDIVTDDAGNLFAEAGWIKVTLESACESQRNADGSCSNGLMYNGGVPVIATYVTSGDGRNLNWVKPASRDTLK